MSATEPQPASVGLQPSRTSRHRHRRTGTAAIAACALGLLAGCGLLQPPTDPPPSSTPPRQTSAPTPTPKPKPSPSPTSREDKAVADSKQVLQAFHKALSRLGNEGGADKIPDYLDVYLTDGPAREFYAEDARVVKKNKIKSDGTHTLRNLRVLNLNLKKSMIIWQACIDQTGVKYTKAGKPFDGAPTYLSEQTELRIDEGVWKVHAFNSEALSDGQDCGDVK